MEEILKNIAKKFFYENNILVKEIDNIILGEKCFLTLVKINNEKYYFKFFITEQLSNLKTEIKLVSYLKENGQPVQDYYTNYGKKLFFSSDKKFYFYGTKNIEGDQIKFFSKKLAKDVIIKIAQLHNSIIKFNDKNNNESISTDYQRLIGFYIEHYKFCQEFNLCEYIEIIARCIITRKKTYYIHSDLYLKNFIIENNKLKAFIDFSDIRKSYLEDDIGKFFQNLMCSFDFTEKDIDKLIVLYEKNSGINIDRKILLISMIYRSIYREYCRLLDSKSRRFNQKTRKVIQNLTNKIIKYYGGN